MFSIIAAIGKNRELGKDGKLIFHIKEDMAFFRETTTGHKVIMGRKTWESLPGKLPGRVNIVVTSQEFDGPDEIIHNLDEFIAKNKNTDEEIFIIGGGAIYEKFLPLAKKMYLTEVDASVEADIYFPEFDQNEFKKQLIKEGKENDLTFAISLYQR